MIVEFHKRYTSHRTLSLSLRYRFMYRLLFCLCSKAQLLAEEETISKETFYDRCMLDPSIRDRLPILTRSLDLNRKVGLISFICNH